MTVVDTVSVPVRRRRPKRRSQWKGLLYITPAMVLVIVFFILPVIGIGFAALAYSDPNLAERDAPTPQAAPAASAPAADPTVS